MKKHTISLEETWLEYPTPTGNAVAVVMVGCNHHCPGCHSLDLQEEAEYVITKEEIVNNIKIYTKRAGTNKLVLIGGDPLFKNNLEYSKYIIKELSSTHNICIYTGYSIDYVKKLNLKGVKYFKCGTFDKNSARESKKTDIEFILASPNQNFYDTNYNQLSTNGILIFNQK